MQTAQEMRSPDDWGREEFRQPPTQEGDEVLFHEPGRILPRLGSGGACALDCRSHSFKVIKPQLGGYALLVRHGGGDESVDLGYSPRILNALLPLDSDSRYWLLHTFLDVFHKTQSETRDRTASEYRRAFASGRLKKRKMPGRDTCKVWIEPEHAK